MEGTFLLIVPTGVTSGMSFQVSYAAAFPAQAPQPETAPAETLSVTVPDGIFGAFLLSDACKPMLSPMIGRLIGFGS